MKFSNLSSPLRSIAQYNHWHNDW